MKSYTAEMYMIFGYGTFWEFLQWPGLLQGALRLSLLSLSGLARGVVHAALTCTCGPARA